MYIIIGITSIIIKGDFERRLEQSGSYQWVRDAESVM